MHMPIPIAGSAGQSFVCVCVCVCVCVWGGGGGGGGGRSSTNLLTTVSIGSQSLDVFVQSLFPNSSVCLFL